MIKGFLAMALVWAFGTQALLASGVQWRTWNQAVDEAKQSGRIIMVDAVRDGCHYCTDMDEAVFQDDAFAAYLEQRFIPVKINITRQQMPQGIHVGMTPSFYFFSPEGKQLRFIPGSWSQEDFRGFLEGIGK